MKAYLRPVIRQLSISAIALLCAGPAAAQGPPALSPDAKARFDRIISEARERMRLPGISVAIALDGAIVYAAGFGMADLEQRVPVTTETRFRTASVAKPLTATAAMLLAERRQLDLDARVQQYCPAFPAKQWPVTTRQLLGHRAGVRHYTRPGESSGTAHYFSIAESLAPFKDDPLLHEPGTKYAYTTLGYNVVGCVIEGASRMRYEAFVASAVLEPAGMRHTAVDDLYQIVPNRARGYELLTEADYKQLPAEIQALAQPNGVYNATLHDTSMKIPGGGWVSTPSDLARFAMGLVDTRLVTAATRDEMWTSTSPDAAYGLGFGVRGSGATLAISHGGNQAGASSFLRIAPSARAVMVIMANLEDAPLNELGNTLGPAVFEEFGIRR